MLSLSYGSKLNMLEFRIVDGVKQSEYVTMGNYNRHFNTIF